MNNMNISEPPRLSPLPFPPSPAPHCLTFIFDMLAGGGSDLHGTREDCHVALSRRVCRRSLWPMVRTSALELCVRASYVTSSFRCFLCVSSPYAHNTSASRTRPCVTSAFNFGANIYSVDVGFSAWKSVFLCMLTLALPSSKSKFSQPLSENW